MEQNAQAPILTKAAMDLFTENYVPDEEERKNPLFSPWLWPTGHKDLPPSYFQICGQGMSFYLIFRVTERRRVSLRMLNADVVCTTDPLRDEGLIFERLMREEEGIKTKLEVYPGLPHGFHSVAPQLKSSQKFIDDTVKGVEWLLQQK